MTVRRIRIWKFFAAVTAGFLLCLAVTAGLFVFQFGRVSKESLGRCNFVSGKIALLNALPGPKIVFIGGSNVHWGVNTESVGRALGRAGGNFGTFAALGPDVILWKARQALKPGDIAVLAFEYDLYHRDGWTSQSLDFVQGCGHDYFDHLSLLDKARTVLAAPLVRVLKLSKGHPNGKLPSNVSHNGDPFLRASTFHVVSKAERTRLSLYRPADIPFDASSRDAKAIRDFAEWAKANKITVWANWPNTIYFQAYENYPSLTHIRDFYRGIGVPVIGKPQDSMLSFDRFYDTQYHLGQQGITERTNRLLDLIKNDSQLMLKPQD